jgi:hypothetical protein
VATRLAGGNRDFGTAEPERFGKEGYHCCVCGAVRGRFRDPDFQLLAPVSTGAPTADARFGGERTDAYCEFGQV